MAELDVEAGKVLKVLFAQIEPTFDQLFNELQKMKQLNILKKQIELNILKCDNSDELVILNKDILSLNQDILEIDKLVMTTFKFYLELKEDFSFRNLLSSDDFCIMQPWCSRRTYQDMTRPLSDYFINASHNTYLFDNHGNDKNNPEVYNQALRAGCRVIEIDCYDGHDDQSVVKHEYSSVKAYPFESVIHFIEPNLFKTSP